jgi:Tfp pilus assembly protein PilN
MARTTGLLPIDPAVSPQHANRVLPIRANLLPSEITSDRNAKRVRFGLVGAVLAVLLLVGGWYAYAVKAKTDAEDSRNVVAEQVRTAQRAKRSHQDVTTIVQEKETITQTLTTLLADDLPWATVLARVRAGSPAGLIITTMTGSLSDGTNIAVVGTLNIEGEAKDKKTIAKYIDALRKTNGITNPYLTSVDKAEDGLLSFHMTAAITTDALCGQFTNSCTTGGK